MMRKRLNVQLWVAVFLTVSGVILLFCGFWVKPTGEIDNTVLVAFGEVSTFAGALFGVDYNYRFKQYLNAKERENKDGE
jgi:drug/metabolite transporter (DMT)-like permease